MENDKFWSWKSSSLRLKNMEEEEKIPPPEAPQEPMEFLSRSWSVSASEISKALAEKKKFYQVPNIVVPQTVIPSQYLYAAVNSSNARRSTVGKWFHLDKKKKNKNKEFSSNKIKKKERARVDNARVHAAVSVAGVAAAVAALAAEANINHPSSKMSTAMASATELLASHCMEIAELTGANHHQVASVVTSAMDVTTAGDLMTLTAAAATALRGAAALKARATKEAKNSAAVIPFEKSVGSSCNLVPQSKMAENCSGSVEAPCKEGKLLKNGHGKAYLIGNESPSMSTRIHRSLSSSKAHTLEGHSQRRKKVLFMVSVMTFQHGQGGEEVRVEKKEAILV